MIKNFKLDKIFWALDAEFNKLFSPVGSQVRVAERSKAPDSR